MKIETMVAGMIGVMTTDREDRPSAARVTGTAMTAGSTTTPAEVSVLSADSPRVEVGVEVIGEDPDLDLLLADEAVLDPRPAGTVADTITITIGVTTGIVPSVLSAILPEDLNA